jgi:hypothetical protein
MKKWLIILGICYAVTANLVLAQPADEFQPKILRSGENYRNTSDSSEFVLSKSAFQQTLELLTRSEVNAMRVKLQQERIVVLEERVAVCDSATILESLEADFWYNKSVETDKLLEQERIERTRWYNSRLFWFTVGAVTVAAVDLSR